MSTRAALVRVADLLEPSLVVSRWRFRTMGSPRLCIVAVYRVANAPRVRRLVDRHPHARVALWGLDGVAPVLQRETVGAGPGTRFTLVNRLIASLTPTDAEWLVVSDDDVELERGDFHDLARTAQGLGMGLVQPVHAESSHLSWQHTRRRFGMVARECAWVEIGPVLALDRDARERVLPFPEDGMGWGLEVEWAQHHGAGLCLGLVDAVRIDHVVPAHGSYDVSLEQRRADARMHRLGLTDDDLPRLQTATRTLRPWSRALWRRRDGSPAAG